MIKAVKICVLWSTLLFSSRSIHMAKCGKRLPDVEGFENRKNSILFYPACAQNAETSPSTFVKNSVVFFGGDSQDYVEIMEKHRENHRHAHWNIENVAKILSRKFPGYNILIVKPATMYLGTFSIYSNFVPSNNYGVPEFQADFHSWLHLKLLLENSFAKFGVTKENFWNSEPRIILIGFSKGCVVLNQLVFELTVVLHQPIANELVNKVTDFYWLDGGHVGGKNTWVTDVSLLKTLASLNANVHVHVTPYQVQDSRRSYLGKEEKKFSETIGKFSTKFERKLHFSDEEPSLDNHFQLLLTFESDKSSD